MAKAKKVEKKTAKERNSVDINIWQEINNNNGMVTEVLYVREQGCLVRDTHTKSGNVTSSWIPNVKPKKKGVNYVLVQDTPEQRAIRTAKRAEKKAAGGTKKKTSKK